MRGREHGGARREKKENDKSGLINERFRATNEGLHEKKGQKKRKKRRTFVSSNFRPRSRYHGVGFQTPQMTGESDSGQGK